MRLASLHAMSSATERDMKRLSQILRATKRDKLSDPKSVELAPPCHFGKRLPLLRCRDAWQCRADLKKQLAWVSPEQFQRYGSTPELATIPME
jgi:hypothetical protein